MLQKLHVDWSALLVDAVNKPGVISKAYSIFHDYSSSNQLLALMQCMVRNIPPGPIKTFPGWLELGRHVKKGEKALTLCMPVTVKSKQSTDKDQAGYANEHSVSVHSFTRFIYRARWFVLGQTEGKEYTPTILPAWDEQTALKALQIERVNFQHLNGNAQGYAIGEQVAVSPIAALPHKTLFHELAHVVLGHTQELKRMDDDEHTPVNLREVEAESVALLCCESLNLGGGDCARGYIQHWLRGQTIPERSVQRIFKSADAILKAGRPSAEQP